MSALTEEVWRCGTCLDADVPEKFRVFGSCYKCAAQKSIDKRNRKLTVANAEIERLTRERQTATPHAIGEGK